MSVFAERVYRGDAIGALKAATVNGALWAIGSSWATAIREIARLVLPEETMDAVFAEALAAGITTVLGVCIALAAARTWCPPQPPPPPLAPARGRR